MFKVPGLIPDLEQIIQEYVLDEESYADTIVSYNTSILSMLLMI